MSINQKGCQIVNIGEPSHNSWHQVPNDDQIADANSEAFDGNSGVKDHRSVRIGDLRQCEERCRSSLKVLGASSLKVESKPGSKSSPQYYYSSKHNPHVRYRKGHSEYSRSNNCVEEIDNTAEPAGLADRSCDISFVMAWRTSAAVVSKILREPLSREPSASVKGAGGEMAIAFC